MFHLIAVLLASLPWLLDSAPAFGIPITAIIAGAIGISAGTVGYAVIGAFVNLAISTGLSMLAKAFSPKRSSALSVQPTQVTVIEPLADRRLVYGRTRVSGTIIYLTTSENNQYLHYVIAVCEGPVDAIETVYLNDDALVLDGSGTATTGTWAGKARVRMYDGTQTAADSLLVAESGGQWTSSHIGYGIAYLYVRLKYDSSVAAMGRPNITAVVRGLKVFDPRTSVTAWSANPALCLRDYLIRTRAKGGVGVNDPVTASAPILTFIDDANFIAQANICDETVALNGGGTEKRYECHGYFDLSPDNEPQERAQRFLSAMAGKPDPQAGLWRVYAGAWRGSSFSITDDHIVGSITVTTRRSLSQQFNAIKGSYLSPESRWTASDYPAITSSAFEAEDGGNRVYKDLDLPFTTSVSMAQRIAKIALYRSRLQMSVTMKCSLAVYAVAIGDVVSVTHDRWGWTAKTFEVTDWSMDLYEGTIALSMRETSAAVYSWSATEEQLRQSSSPTTLPNWSLVSAPSPLSYSEGLVESRNSLGVKNQVTLTVSPPPDAFVNGYEFDIKLSANSAWISSGVTSTTNWVFDDVLAGTYDFRVRARNVLGATSAYTTLTNKPIYSLTAAPSNPSGLAAQTAGGVIILTWDRSPDLDVRIGGQTIIRWTPLTTGVTWETTTSACEPVNGDATQALVPSRTGTYVIKFIDSSGIFSANYVSITADQASVIPYPNLTTAQEDNTFTGTKTNCVVASGALNLTTGQIDGTYIFASGIDQTTVKTARLTAVIQALCYNSSDLFDSSELFDSAELFDGAGAADSDAWVEYRATNDNPSGSPVWGAWARVDASEVKARAFQFRARLTATNTNFNIAIQQLRVKVETP